MCEFKVFLNGEKVFEEAVYARTMEGDVVLRDILGEQKVFKDCYLKEVDVASEKLTLSPTISEHENNPQRMRGLRGALTRAAEFHGHLGPFLVVGVRMGWLALDKLKLKPMHDQSGPLTVVVETGIRPPMSCMIDGIQWSTGCTLGKGKIRIEDLGRPNARFNSEGEELRIALKDKVLRKIENSLKLHPFMFHDLNEEIISLREEELFQVDQSPRKRYQTSST